MDETLKNIIVTVDVGERVPDYYFFQAESFEDLENTELYRKTMSVYPDGLEMTIYPNVPLTMFNKKLEQIKELKKVQEQITAEKNRLIKKGCKKLEKQGKQVFLIDWDGERIYYTDKKSQRV